MVRLVKFLQFVDIIKMLNQIKLEYRPKIVILRNHNKSSILIAI
jgi:hypothetical protein